jgi:hypothetical protein
MNGNSSPARSAAPSTSPQRGGVDTATLARRMSTILSSGAAVSGTLDADTGLAYPSVGARERAQEDAAARDARLQRLAGAVTTILWARPLSRGRGKLTRILFLT